MIEFLKACYNNTPLSCEETSALMDLHNFQEVKRGSILLNIDQLASCYWVVKDGLLRSFVVSPKGDDMTSNFFVRGDIALDFTGFFLHKPSLEGIEVLSDAKIWRVEKEGFNKFMRGCSAFGKWGKNWMVSNLIARQQFHLSHHTDTAKERYERLIKERPLVNQLAPLKCIASYIGVTDSTLSRLRRQVDA